MVWIITGLIVAFLNMLLPELLVMADYIVDLAFKAEDVIGGYFADAFDVLYNVGISLIVLKFLKKGFEIYVLWTDGDADNEPFQLFINFVKAIAVAVAFRPIYDLFVRVLKNIIDETTKGVIINGDEQSLINAVSSLGLLPAVISLISFIMLVILCVRTMGLGVQLILLNIGMPVSCIGLLDNDKGVFQNYFMLYVKTFLTVLIQVVLTKIGMYITLSNQLDVFNLYNNLWGIVVMVTAFRAPHLLSEFLVPTPQGGGVGQRVYSATMMVNAVRRVIV